MVIDSCRPLEIDFLSVDDKASAIQCLYDSLDPTKNKIWCSTIEDAINKLLDICIDIFESESAKEALSQYRNICQLLVRFERVFK